MHTSSSQEVQSQVLAALLKPIRDLPQNWKVDLAKHLEKYLHQLYEMSMSSGNGINFAEAALLIQTSAGIYGKKVEYLWQILQQVLESFREEKKTSGKNNENVPRKRSSCISDSFRDFLEIEPTRDKEKKKKDEHQKPIKFQPYIYSQLENKAPNDKRINIFGNMMEPLGDKTDYRLNNQISNRFILEEEMSVTMSIATAQLLSTELAMNTSVAEVNMDSSQMEVDPTESHPMEEQSFMPLDDVNDDYNADDNDHHSLNTDDLAIPIEKEFVNKRVGQQPRERLVTVPVSVDHWKGTDGIDNIPDKLLKRRMSYKLPCDIALLKPDSSKKRKYEDKRIDVMTIMVRMLTTDTSKWGLGKKLFDNAQDFRIEYLGEIKNRKRRERFMRQRERKELHKNLSKEFTPDFRGFEDYEPSSGEEDGFAGYPDELSEQPENNHEAEFPPPSTFQNSAIPFLSHADPGSVDSESYQSIVQQKLEEFAQLGKQCLQSNLMMRVNEWHTSIRPVLEAAHQRGHFDIHQYGTKILESFPKGNGKTTIAFADVVRGEVKEDVSRYFLASLVLANMYNVEISKSDPEELAMDCMELTLLKAARHHEALEDYQAPSQAKRTIPSSSTAQPVHSEDHQRKRGK